MCYKLSDRRNHFGWKEESGARRIPGKFFPRKFETSQLKRLAFLLETKAIFKIPRGLLE